MGVYMKCIVYLNLFMALGLMISMEVKASGPSTSGGGFAFVCRNGTDQIVSSELLDLYEARTVYGFELMKSSGNVMRDYVRAVKNGYRLQGSHPHITEQEMIENVEKFQKITIWLSEDEKLPNLDDLGLKISVPLGCKIEPLAIFYDLENIVVIDREIWNVMDSLSKSALVIHEIYYRYYRHLTIDPDTNSLEARLITASDFSTNLVPVRSGIPLKSSYGELLDACHFNQGYETSCSELTTYHIFSTDNDSDERQNLRIQFTSLAGRPLISQTTVDLPQRVNFGDIFPLKSRQLIGWTAEVTQDKTRFDGTAIRLLIKRGKITMAEIPL